MTILSGHGRSTVNAESSSIAIVAAHSGRLNGLSRGSTRRISCRVNPLSFATGFFFSARSAIGSGPKRSFSLAHARENQRAVVVADPEQLACRARGARQTAQDAPRRYGAQPL